MPSHRTAKLDSEEDFVQVTVQDAEAAQEWHAENMPPYLSSIELAHLASTYPRKVLEANKILHKNEVELRWTGEQDARDLATRIGMMLRFVNAPTSADNSQYYCEVLRMPTAYRWHRPPSWSSLGRIMRVTVRVWTRNLKQVNDAERPIKAISQELEDIKKKLKESTQALHDARHQLLEKTRDL
ncbi:hypothetical protein EK21DRAFT_115203 [Setomelanomma holmii]|uniref:Uncharacterized protein n=1 Tax=Setomelanomma holmii TaxID=210430 RepID=A0A9P4H3P3_9PLEO|nr:hypothetical protein EK21DRAFT_115203 [Setomelanomma holmii]